MKLYLKVMGCSCYTCLPRTAPAAAQSARKTAAPGTGTGVWAPFLISFLFYFFFSSISNSNKV